MQNNRNRQAGEGRGRRQKKFCSNEGFGQGRERNCDYRRNTGSADSQPKSIVATVFDGLDKFIERSRKTVALLSSKKDPAGFIDSTSNRSKDRLQLEKGTSKAADDKPDETVKQISDRK